MIQVDGLIDPPNAQLIVDAVHAANRDHSQILVIKINSGGAVNVDPDRVIAASSPMSRVPVVAWIGPSGSKARGLAALVALNSAVAGVSNGSSIGPIEPDAARRSDDAGHSSSTVPVGAGAPTASRAHPAPIRSARTRRSPRA